MPIRSHSIILSCGILAVGMLCCSGGDNAGARDSGTADGTVDDGTTGDADEPSVEERLRESFEASGFHVQEGKVEFSDLSACEFLPTCFGNNPTSPYGQYRLPPAPGQPEPDPGTGEDGLSSVWHLRPDEAIVYFGRTPPEARYFSFRSYLFDRDDGTGTGGRITLFASLGDSLNNAVIATEGTPAGGPGDPSDQTTLVITTVDCGIRDRVMAAAEAAGLSRDIMNTDVVPSDVIDPGIQAVTDTFSVLIRVAMFADQQAGDAYVADPPGIVLRLTPGTPAAPDACPMPALRPRGTGIDEFHLQSSLDDLEAAVRSHHAGLQAWTLDATYNHRYGFECIADGENCNGDNRDAIYASNYAFRLFDVPNDFVIVFGVNHRATGKATYSNFAVYYLLKLLGVVAVDDIQMEGSAETYLPGHPDADLLYAYRIARNCYGESFCVEVPYDFPGLPDGEWAAVAFRAYLEPSTRTGPEITELLLSRAIKFTN